MTAGRKRLLLILLGVAIALWALGAVTTPMAEGLDVKTKTDNVILVGLPFILIFIGIIIAFIDFIILMASLLNGKVAVSTYKPIERLLIAGIVLGVIGMFQPFSVTLYTFGFLLLLVSTLTYIFWSHIMPRVKIDRATHHEEGLTSVSVSQIEKNEARG